jgi:hypothetical protein
MAQYGRGGVRSQRLRAARKFDNILNYLNIDRRLLGRAIRGRSKATFHNHGADIPDELIRSVTEGNATFLCGAGVSLRVGLPTFRELTEKVYAHMGETYTGEPAEAHAMNSKEYDRALRALEKRTHLPRTESRVRKAVWRRAA